MASVTDLTIRTKVDTAQAIAVLEVISKHAKACAEELRSLKDDAEDAPCS